MSFPRYPKYRDSGVEWLGEIPEHWSAGRFSRVISAIKDGTHGTFERVPAGNPLLSAKNVQDGYLQLSDEESLIRESDHLSIVSNGFPAKGDLLLTIVGTIGRSCVYEFDYPLAFQRSVCFIRLLPRNCTRFFYYLTQSKFFQEQLSSKSKSAAQGGVYMGDVVATTLAYPSFIEQTQIVAFLDRETGKIDALIAEQQRLIDLLKEKRQAVISRAVTKGLNPDAPMKPSGIEWLGDVPAHWEVLRVRSVSTFATSGPRGWSERVSEQGSLFIQSGDLNDSLEVKFAESKRVHVEDDAEAARTQLRNGDVVVCITGAKTGNVAVCSVVPETAYINQHLCLIRPTQDVLPTFLGVLLKSKLGQTYFELSQYGLKQGLSLEDVKDAPVLLPPVDEQVEILTFLDCLISKFDALSLEVHRAVGLLQERRSALISAAVTGQIDVRAFAERQAA